MPRWVTDEILQGKETFEYTFKNTIIVLFPKKELIKDKPRSYLFNCIEPRNKSFWLRIKYDDQGITFKGLELADWFHGTDPEIHDSPGVPNFN